jgi:hypothetical protein
MPSNEIHQGNFEVVPVPLNLCMHLQLLYFAAAVDVVGQCMPPSVRVRSDKVPSERSKSAKIKAKATPRWKKGGAAYCSPIMGVTSMSKLRKTNCM